MSKKLTAFVLGAALLMGTAACAPPGASPTTTTTASGTQSGSNATTAPTAASGITVAMTAPWDTYIPFNTTSQYSDTVLDLVFDRLMFMHADGTFSPRLADSWERSADSTKITFHLNKAAKWHDGTPVTADDVVFTSNVYASPDLSVARRSMMNSFAGTDASGMQAKEGDIQVKALDANTVEFTLKEAAPTDFLLSLRFREIFIIPKHIFGDKPIAQILEHEGWTKPVGSGPYKYVSEISGERIEFAANQDYFLGEPAFDQLVLRVVDASNLLTGLMNGEIDVVGGGASVPLDDWEMTKQQANLTAESVSTHSYQYMTLNTKKPYLSQAVRQAINLAIDRERIVKELLMGEGKVAAGPISELSAYFNSKLLPVSHDVAKAKTMLEAEKFPFDQVLIMSVPKGNLVRERSAVLIQQDLEKVGIKTEIRTVDFPTHMEVLRKGDYDLGLIGSGGPVDPSQSVLDVTPGHVNNFSQNEDPTLGQIGLSGQSKLTEAERKTVYDEYQMVMKEQAPFLFLYYPNTLIAYNNRLTNVKTADFPIRNMNVSEWKLK